jgi:hypothetical protein
MSLLTLRWRLSLRCRFNWDNDHTPVVKDGFKNYLAVVIPLTVVVFVVVFRS